MGFKNLMAYKYRCCECADKKRSWKCYETGVCKYAGDFEEEEKTVMRKPQKRRVRCVETGVVYDSVLEAERAIGVKGGLTGVVDNPNRAYKGYHFASV